MTKKPNTSGARKSAFLGMPHGTASNRLRKLILFHPLQKPGENVCFRCSREIETVGELSIEHRLPSEGVDVQLFWSIDNIAFSHLNCNVPHRYAGGQARRRKVGPDGTGWCRRCKAFLPVKNFGRNRTRWSGLQAWCNDCMKARSQRRDGDTA